MKRIFATFLLAAALTGCAGVPHYQTVIKAPAPDSLAGVWTSHGAQKGLVNPEAIATLIISRNGDTLDCRQWQRTIVRPGKLTLRAGDLYNINVKDEVEQLEMSNDTLLYNNLVLQRASAPTAECQPYVSGSAGNYQFVTPALPKASAKVSEHKKSGVERKNTKD